MSKKRRGQDLVAEVMTDDVLIAELKRRISASPEESLGLWVTVVDDEYGPEDLEITGVRINPDKKDPHLTAIVFET
jgi:hypothetical protein